MRKLLPLLAMAGLLAGCASKLPTCDGKDRRPINEPGRAELHYPSCGAAA
ncbi:hypothetical protein FBX97_3115 [Herbaspirillum sp. SJZ107]|nr:hypothetical protein FBX97_3115 [Herbaspirillum sp. SJZ107]